MTKRAKTYSLIAATIAALAMGSGTASAALTAVGAVSPVTTLPTFYQDSTGMALGLCLEQKIGLCILTPEFDPTVNLNPLPITTTGPINDTNFPNESFYFLAESQQSVAGGADSAILRIVLEAAFLNPNPPIVIPNQGITFLRINMKKMSGLTPLSTYTVTHPYGTFNFSTDANGDTLLGQAGQGFRTEDPVNPVEGVYDALLPAPTTGVGPFLQRAAGPITDVTTGIRYIGDPRTISAVTGSPTGNNFVRITGPNIGGPGVNTITEPGFTLAGQIMGLDISPTTPASFGVWKTGATSTPQTYTLTNLTGAPAGPLTVTPPAGFTLAAGSTCNGATLNPIAPGNTCVINLAFAPGADGLVSGNTTITATGVPTANISATGTGDGTAPALAITTISHMSPQTTQTISGTVSDVNGISSVLVSVNGGPAQAATVGNGTWSFNIAAGLNANAANSISVIASDNAQPAPGNQTTVTDSITVDTIPPAAVVDAVAATVTNESLQVSGAATDVNGISSLGVKLNGTLLGLATVTGGTWSFNIPALVPNKPSVITATATDSAGNQTTSTPVTTTFTVPVDGDMNLDGKVDVADALLALRSSVGLVIPTAVQKAHGDCAPLNTQSGLPAPNDVLDVSDALLILRKVVGLVTSF